MPADSGSPSQPRRYAVFLSYRHADNKERGRQWGIWLHQVLESYEVPPDLVGKPNSRGEPILPNLYPVFRDEEELPADADLTRNIRQALENSNLLVVLCSPRAVASRFVAEEIRYFKELGKADRILALIIDGEPNASNDPAKQAAGITPELECFPKQLRFGVARTDHSIDWTVTTEPVAADARPEGLPMQGWTTGAAYREQLLHDRSLGKETIERKVRQYEERLELAKLKIIAGALSIPLGVLTQRDKATQLLKAQRRLRTIRRVAIGFILLGLLTTVAAAVAWRQRSAAKREAQRAELARQAQVHVSAMSFYDRALESLRENNVFQAMPYVAAALRLEPNSTLVSRMAGALLLDPTVRLPLNPPVEGGSTFSFDFSPDGQHALASWSDRPAEWIDLNVGRVVGPIKRGTPPIQAIGASFSSSGACAVLGMKSVAFWDKGEPAANEPTRNIWLNLSLGKILLTAGARNLIFTMTEPDIEDLVGRLAGRSVSGQARIIETRSGAIRERKIHEGTILKTAAIPGSDDFLTLGTDRKLRQWVPDVESPVGEYLLPSAGVSLAVSPKGDFAAAGGADGKVTLINLRSHQANQMNGISNSLRAEDIAFNPDGTHFAIGFSQSSSHNGWIRIWDTKGAVPTSSYLLADDWISHLAFDQSGTRIGYLCREGLAGIADGTTAACVAKWKAGARGDNVQFVAGQDRLAVAVDQRSLRTYSDGFDLPLRWRIHCPANVRQLAIDSGGKQAIAVLGDQRDRHVWVSLEQGALSGAPTSHSRLSIADAYLFGSGQEPIALLLMDDGSVESWNAAGNMVARRSAPAGLDRLLQSGDVPPEGFNFGGALGRYARSDPETLLVASTLVDREKWSALLNDVDQHRLDPQKSAEEVQRRVFSTFRGRVESLEVRTLKPAWQVEYPAPLIHPRLSVDGKTLVAMDSRNARLLVWKRGTDNVWKPLPLPVPRGRSDDDVVAINGVNLSPDGRWLLIDGNTALICDLKAPRLSWQDLAPGQSIASAGFAPDTPLVALQLKANDSGGIVQLWDVETRQPVTPKLTHTDRINSFRFSNDGSLVVTCSGDKTVRVWDVAAGRLALPAFKTTGPVNDALVLPGGSALIFGGNDDCVNIVPLPPADRAPDWVPPILEAVSGNRIDEQGRAQAVALSTAFDVRPKMQTNRPSPRSWDAVSDWLWRRPQSSALALGRSRPELLLQEALTVWEMRDHSLARFYLSEALHADPGLKVPAKLTRLRDLIQPGEPATVETWDGRSAGSVIAGPAGIRFRWCPPGRFVMGSPPEEPGHSPSERARVIILTHGFWMSETEITQSQWTSIMDKSALDHAIERVSDPTRFSRNGSSMTLQQMLGLKSPDVLKTFESWFRPECPIFLVSAREADSFVQKVSDSITKTPLSDLPGRWRCALPSEAQWEFACRAGTVDATYAGPLILKGKENSPTLSGIAWYRGNSSQDFSGPGWISNSWMERETPGDTAGVHPVGLKQPNPWGLKDMLGNVFEWCADTWRNDFPDGEVDPFPSNPNADRVLRGASANSTAKTLRCAFRVHEPADFRSLEVGLRVILEPVVD